MVLAERLADLRRQAKLSQEKFAELFHVSQQSVQKWESGTSVPDLDKLIQIAKRFDVSIDALVLGSDSRLAEELNHRAVLKPKYANMHDWESYFSELMTEYRQSMEEGLDIGSYRELFTAVSQLPKGEIKKKLSDVLFEIVSSAPVVPEYPYVEPSDLEGIRSLRREIPALGDIPEQAVLENKIAGAWLGRICGCLLGKPVEGVRTNELIPFLKDTGNFPLHRYILSTDLTPEIVDRYNFRFPEPWCADKSHGMPADDDTNYVVLAQLLIERYGRDFTPNDVARIWLSCQSKDAYCTAERVAFCNFIRGYEPPVSAVYKNPYREWIGAQIRGDYFGYINPGNPELAAEMAFRDASISHIKNGIYGEMFISAMLAAAAVTDDLQTVLRSGLAQIPHTSRLYEAVTGIMNGYEAGVSQADCFAGIHEKYDEHNVHDWCHTISNAMIVVASLLYGGGDYGRSICMAVETGFDTDCNGATVGSVLGMLYGADHIDSAWTGPLEDTLYTAVFGMDKLKISDRIQLTFQQMPTA